jgi:hypothetical protein
MRKEVENILSFGMYIASEDIFFVPYLPSIILRFNLNTSSPRISVAAVNGCDTCDAGYQGFRNILISYLFTESLLIHISFFASEPFTTMTPSHRSG